MTSRKIRKTVTFMQPFLLCDSKPVLPAGTYLIDVEEDRVEGLSFQTFLRKQITLYLPGGPVKPGMPEMMKFAPRELAAALFRDQRATDAALFRRQKLARQAGKDRSAIERAENEGMLPVG